MGFVNELTGTETGFSEDGSAVRLYNPNTNKYKWYSTNGDTMAWNPAGENTDWGYDRDGNRTLMYQPGKTAGSGGFNPDFEGWQAGYTPAPTPPAPDRNGMGSDGGQRNPSNTDDFDPTLLQPTPGSPGGAPDPFAPSNPANGGNNFNWGGGGGIIGREDVETGFDVDPFNPANQIGFENSTNRDFYQLQSAAQRAQGFRNVLREQNAMSRAAEAQNNPAETPSTRDMWDWTLGPQQTLGDRFGPIVGTGVDNGAQDSPDFVRNPVHSWESGMSNADLLRRFADLPVFEQYGDNYQDWITDQDAAGGSEWSTYNPNSGNPNPFTNGNPIVNDLFNVMWTNPTDVRQFGQPNAPYGYASPLSPATTGGS